MSSSSSLFESPEVPYVYSSKKYDPDPNDMRCALENAGTLILIASILTLIFTRKLSFWNRVLFWWFAFDASIHTFFEGPFVIGSLLERYTGGVSLAKLPKRSMCVWTEYGKSDYRWLYSDPGIVSMELATVTMEAPLSWLILYLIVKDSCWKHVVQFIISFGELYGLFMTFVPEWLYGSPNLDGSTFLYYWVYLGSNIPWLIIPGYLTFQSMVEMANALELVKNNKTQKKLENGNHKKNSVSKNKKE